MGCRRHMHSHTNSASAGSEEPGTTEYESTEVRGKTREAIIGLDLPADSIPGCHRSGKRDRPEPSWANFRRQLWTWELTAGLR